MYLVAVWMVDWHDKGERRSENKVPRVKTRVVGMDLLHRMLKLKKKKKKNGHVSCVSFALMKIS